MKYRNIFTILFFITFVLINLSFAQDDTEKFFIDQVKSNPNDVQNYYNLGTYYTTINNNKKAILCLQKAIEIKPNYFEAQVTLGNAYESQNQKELAIETYKKALTIRPDKNLTNKIEALQKTNTVKEDSFVPQNTPKSNTIMNNNSDTTSTKLEDYFSDKYLYNLLLLFVIIIIIIVLMPAFFLWLSSIIVKIETNTFFKSFIAVIASDFIYIFIVAISNKSSTGAIVAFIFSIIVIQAVYETTFNKALLTWVFSSLLFIGSMYLLMISATSMFLYSDLPYKIAKFIKDKNQWTHNEINSLNKSDNNSNKNANDYIKTKCISNMKTIEGALELFRMENKTSNNIISVNQLSAQGYLRSEPKCDLKKSDYIILIDNKKNDIYCPSHNLYLSKIK